MKQSRPDPASPSLLLEQYRREISRCVKCGSCRAVCPTFLLDREESHSARGRMALVKAVLDKRLPVSKIYRDRLTTCTGCLACETACPSGVRVTEILRAAKEQAVLDSGTGIINSAISSVVKRPALFRAAAWLAPIVLHYSGGQGAGERKKSSKRKVQSSRAAGARGRVAFFPGCAIEHFQPDIGNAAIGVLNAIGYEVIMPEDLKCCGRPLLSLGDVQAAEELAAHNASVFAAREVDAIVTACASCGLTFKEEYPKLLRPGVKSPRVLDIHEFLSHALAGTDLNPVRKTITWHDPCHLGRGQGLSKTARDVLCSIPGLSFVEMHNADRCCGFGGVMRITHHRLSDGIAEDKAKSIIATGASVVATGCPGCRMQITDALRRKGSDITVVHTVQLLEAALANTDRGPRNTEFEMTGPRARRPASGK